MDTNLLFAKRNKKLVKFRIIQRLNFMKKNKNK
jgi:hypothetical protein